MNLKHNNIIIILLTFFIIIYFNFPLIEAKQEIDGEISANKITIINSDSSFELIAEGNVFLIYNEIRIRSDYGKMNRERDEIFFAGHVEISDREYLMKGEEFEGNLDNYKLRKNVELNGTEFKLKGDLLIYNRENERIVLEEEPHLDFKGIVATANKITYFIEDNYALLEGDVKGNNNGESFSADRLEIDFSLESGTDITLTGKARIVFSPEGEK
jgi:lipopolysaccharide assembly outer membrane protein LptD (OstA)